MYPPSGCHVASRSGTRISSRVQYLNAGNNSFNAKEMISLVDRERASCVILHHASTSTLFSWSRDQRALPLGQKQPRTNTLNNMQSYSVFVVVFLCVLCTAYCAMSTEYCVLTGWSNGGLVFPVHSQWYDTGRHWVCLCLLNCAVVGCLCSATIHKQWITGVLSSVLFSFEVNVEDYLSEVVLIYELITVISNLRSS